MKFIFLKKVKKNLFFPRMHLPTLKEITTTTQSEIKIQKNDKTITITKGYF